MRRRAFITLMGGGAAAWSFTVRAQQPGRVRRIGVLMSTAADDPLGQSYIAAFAQGLQQLGWRVGANVQIDTRWGAGDTERFRKYAAELVASAPDVIVGTAASIVGDLQQASRTVPIVFVTTIDPVGSGLVASLARPGGNITGIVSLQTELAGKQVELLTQAFPDRSRLAVLYDETSADQFAAADRQARSLHLDVQSLKLENPPYDFDAAFRSLAEGTPQMLLVLSSEFFTLSRSHIAELAIQQRLPTMFIFKIYVQAGGLISYGVDPQVMFRQVGFYVSKILNGSKPADLPVEQAAKFELVINLKTAKAIGVDLSTAIQLRADEVIE